MRRVLLATAAILPTAAQAQEVRIPVTLDEMVVTATGRPEPRSSLAGTVQVIDQETIRRSTAQNMTDLLAENAVGFFSEWTPGQTSINIRGGATDGQGRDFRSQVLVLVNGRRAGTANLSKLSPAEVERIEIIRGPASVVYGSQAIGGVINLIMRDGRTSPGGFAEVAGGSWGLAEGRLRYGMNVRDVNVAPQGSGAYDIRAGDIYVGLSGGRRDSYGAGNGGPILKGTQWNRAGGAAALGVETNIGRIGLSARTDGTYNTGFLGSAWNTSNHEDRTNHSADLTLEGATADARFRWNLQAYAVRDIDNLRWRAPIQRSAAGLPMPGTDHDDNRRVLDIFGTRLQPSMRLWQGAEILVGLDLERSVLRSTRSRIPMPGGPAGQVSPLDNNQTDMNAGLYTELSQQLFDDRVTLRAGVRQTWGNTAFDPTPNLPLQRAGSQDYDATTWSAGASWRPVPSVALRANASTGFRAPTATELAADFTALGGGRTFGNANLKPETNLQYEVGAAWFRSGFRADLALFQNTISDRIITRVRPRDSTTSDYANNPGDVVVRGLEVQLEADLARHLGIETFRWRANVNASWNFDMRDDGASRAANTRNVERMYRYQAGISTTVSQPRWDVTLQGILRGPVHYNTEENLLIPQAEPFRDYVHRKDAFWVFNLRASVQPFEDRPNLRVFGAINNILDENYHALFIATASNPFLGDARLANGGRGNSAPGREFIGGLRFTF
ncbi:TonB-dependent receptor [Roseococcus sp. SYP-B2431]|uniref:TonB-dependent receptor n=1 Tax=Roseococcus sp. SYP-B2431 TaxID=2496640 RepID=UPI00103F23C5|nr:TonB-dependent receptor [Roseococcus sp. SYP-B2431]TCH98187.1 TonB-dependent receptor [Roseococcus sp. SYP-B2431]